MRLRPVTPGVTSRASGHVASGRQRQQALEIAGDVDGLNRLLRFEQLRIAAHDNALFHAPEREDDIEGEVEPGPDFDALPRELREAHHLRDDVEDAWREVQEPVLSVGVADTGVRAGSRRAHRGHADAWQDSASGVADHTPHGAFTGDPRARRSSSQEHQQGNQVQPSSHRRTLEWKRPQYSRPAGRVPERPGWDELINPSATTWRIRTSTTQRWRRRTASIGRDRSTTRAIRAGR